MGDRIDGRLFLFFLNNASNREREQNEKITREKKKIRPPLSFSRRSKRVTHVELIRQKGRTNIFT